jgi:hypothetical protein
MRRKAAPFASHSVESDASAENARSYGRRTAFEGREVCKALAGQKVTLELAAQAALPEQQVPLGRLERPVR